MEQSITLYLSPLTTNSIKMRLICNALEIHVDYRIVELHKGEHHTPWFNKLNPESKIPVLIDEHITLTESNAILQYLATKYRSTLWPNTSIQQAKVLEMLFWQLNYFNSAVGTYAHTRVVLPEWGIKSRPISEAVEADFHQALSSLENILEHRTAIAGNHFTIADISVASHLIFAEQANMPIENYIATLDWLSRLEDLPWFLKTKDQLYQLLTVR